MQHLSRAQKGIFRLMDSNKFSLSRAIIYSCLDEIVKQIQDVEGVELCGTLKNVVAIAAGL